MPQFQPIRVPFECLGVDLVHPPDRQPQGKYPFLNNARSVQEGTITARPGYGAPLNAVPFDQANVHSIRRMNNSLPGANPTSRRFVGAGTKLYSADAGVIDTGYSGDPLSLVVWRPDQSVEPWMYVGDKNKMRKCRMDGSTQTNYQVGITPPTAAPVCTLSQPFYQEIQDFFSISGWSNSGDAGSPSSVARAAASTTIGNILYDTGTTGWANVAVLNSAGNYGWLGLGMLLTFNQGAGNGEEVVVQEVHLKVASTTILGIQYDVGTTGLATVQAAEPLAGIDRNSLMDFNVGSMSTEEVASILSYTIGPDGLYSFRVRLGYTHVAGEPIAGVPSFRCYTTHNHVPTEPITATAMKSTVTFSTGTGKLTNTALYSPSAPLNLSQCSSIIGGGGTSGRPLTPDDYLHISLLVNNPAAITQILVQLDVDAATNNFTQNYYQINVQQNLAQALLTGGATALNTLETAAQATLINEVVAPSGGPGFAGAAASPNLTPNFLQLYGGNNAWTEILVPLSELQRVGSDTTRSLANVAAFQIIIQCSATVNIEISSWYVGGGYGCNTGLPESQYLNWRYRYRSSLTGAKSQQSPGVRTGVQAYRQQGLITPTVSTDPQVDWIDIERFGGVLNEWHYVGSVPNNAGDFPFSDSYMDDEIKTAPALEIDTVLPFPSFDVPMTGICNVVGTDVKWVSGATFNTSWAPGQEILIDGIAYTVYGQPNSTTDLQTVENVGVLTGVPFVVAEPTLIGQPLPHIIGPFEQGQFLLGWGDPRNPGTIYATKGNDPDSAPIQYYLELSDPSEPIVGGVVWDNNAIIASNKRFWRISIDANAVQTGQGNVLVKQELQVGRGLFAPWAICAGPLIWFLDEAGVPCETGGGPAVSIVEDDLRPLFPHDGSAALAVNGYNPPDLTQTTKLRMAYANGKMRFMFQDTTAAQVSWDYDPTRKGWKFNTFAVPINLAYWEEGESLDSELLCGQNGNVYQVGGFSDNGAAITVNAQVPYQFNSRTEKFVGDNWLDADPQGVTNLTVQQTFDLGAVVNTAQPIAGASRAQYPLNTSNSNGQLARNAGLLITWSSASAAPVLYEWQPWFYDTGTVLRTSWASLPTSHGLEGWQHMREGYLPFLMPVAGTVNLIVTIDGVAQVMYPFNPTANRLQKLLVDFLPAKGLMYEWQLQSSTPFLIFAKDLEIKAKSWGSTGPYLTLKPFGDLGE